MRKRYENGYVSFNKNYRSTIEDYRTTEELFSPIEDYSTIEELFSPIVIMIIRQYQMQRKHTV